MILKAFSFIVFRMDGNQQGTVFFFSNNLVPNVINNECEKSGLEVVFFNDPFVAINNIKLSTTGAKSQSLNPSKDPVVIITDDKFTGICGIELITILQKRWPYAPIIVCLSEFDTAYVSTLVAAGAFDVLLKPVRLSALCYVMERALQINRTFSKNRETIVQLEQSESLFHEKAVVMETILELLSHDSKNIFLKIRALLLDMEQSPEVSMLQDAVDELYNGTMEAVSYIDSGRRIESVDALVGALKLTRDRVPLATHKRISFKAECHSVLFAEVSALFKNAVINIVENALKYSPSDTMVEVDISRFEGLICIQVKDHGNGIPDEDKERIFERNYRRAQTSGVDGTGKGLWITRNIIKKEGGIILVKDNPDGGALFTIEIPPFKIESLDAGLLLLQEWYPLDLKELNVKAQNIRTLLSLQQLDKRPDLDSLIFVNLLDYLRRSKGQNDLKRMENKLLKIKMQNPEGRPVLIVDDSPYVHYYLGTYLVKLGYRIVGFARNGQEGVNYYKELKPELVTLDVTMPVMSGIEAAKLIREQNSDALILFLTGLGEHQPFLESIAQIFPDSEPRVLTKPFTIEQLKELLIRMNF